MILCRIQAACAVLLLLALPARGQVVDPAVAEFTPSADHETQLPDGRDAVDAYELEFYHVGATLPFQTASLGKPTPVDGLIRANLADVMAALPPPGVVYEARVAALGAGGVGRSDPSNQFFFAEPPAPPQDDPPQDDPPQDDPTPDDPPQDDPTPDDPPQDDPTPDDDPPQDDPPPDPNACSFAVAPTEAAAANSSRTGFVSGSFALSTQQDCVWTAQSSDAWLEIRQGSGELRPVISGTGSATIDWSVNSNRGGTRVGAVTVAEAVFTVTQAGGRGSQSLSTVATLSVELESAQFLSRHPHAPLCGSRRWVTASGDPVPGVRFPRSTHPYVPTREGWLYLAVLLDLCSRRVVGWAL